MSDTDRQPESSTANRSGWTSWLLRRAAVLLLIYAGLLIMLSLLENSLLFFPMPYPAGNWNPAGLPIEDAEFAASDGTKLHGWFLPHDQPRAVVLFAHGNAGNITHRLDQLIHFWQQHRVSIMCFDYRGYGRSEGTPTESGVLDDARAARTWLAKRAGVGEQDIVLMGESLGGGVVVDLAARDGAKGLLLQNTFTSLPDVAAYHYWYVPVRLLMRNKLDSRALIGEYHGPLVQCHGDRDSIVPYELGKQLHEAANEPKILVTLRGHDHNDPMVYPGDPSLEEYDIAVDAFFTALSEPEPDE